VDIIKRIHALQNQRREEVFKKALILLAKHDHNFMKCFNGINMKSLSKFISSGAFNKKPQYADIEIIKHPNLQIAKIKNNSDNLKYTMQYVIVYYVIKKVDGRPL